MGSQLQSNNHANISRLRKMLKVKDIETEKVKEENLENKSELEQLRKDLAESKEYSRELEATIENFATEPEKEIVHTESGEVVSIEEAAKDLGVNLIPEDSHEEKINEGEEVELSTSENESESQVSEANE